MMSFCSSVSSVQSFSFFSDNNFKPFHSNSRPVTPLRASASDVPDFLSADWSLSLSLSLSPTLQAPLPPPLSLFTAEDAVHYQLDALKYNDQPRHDYGIEVMYRFAGFDPFERSTYFGPFFDLGQFERFRRIFHHSSYRVLLGHKDRRILSSLFVKEWTCLPGKGGKKQL